MRRNLKLFTVDVNKCFINLRKISEQSLTDFFRVFHCCYGCLILVSWLSHLGGKSLVLAKDLVLVTKFHNINYDAIFRFHSRYETSRINKFVNYIFVFLENTDGKKYRLSLLQYKESISELVWCCIYASRFGFLLVFCMLGFESFSLDFPIFFAAKKPTVLNSSWTLWKSVSLL